MNTETLRQFLVDSNKAGYATGEEKEWITEPDGSTTIPFVMGVWRSQDNYFGGEPYGGRVVVFYRDKPMWIMVYYGYVVEGVEVDPVYKILRGALREMPDEHPYRGPKEYRDGRYIYLNAWEGGLENFAGKEKIFDGDALIYEADYRGGLVDQRSGL